MMRTATSRQKKTARLPRTMSLSLPTATTRKPMSTAPTTASALTRRRRRKRRIRRTYLRIGVTTPGTKRTYSLNRATAATPYTTATVRTDREHSSIRKRDEARPYTSITSTRYISPCRTRITRRDYAYISTSLWAIAVLLPR